MSLWSRKSEPTPEPEPAPKVVPTFTLTSREITLLTGLAADANPEDHTGPTSDEIKAVIYKAKTMCQRAVDHGSIDVEIDFTRRRFL